jgi:hypothetical protein
MHKAPSGKTCGHGFKRDDVGFRRPLAPAPAHVAKADNVGWSLYGAQRSQPMATCGKWARAESGSEKRNGKEGVDGSSPSEGFAKFLQVSSFCLPVRRRFSASTSTERPPISRGALGVAWKPCW